MDAFFYSARQQDERTAREAAGQDTPLFAGVRSNFEADRLKAEGALIFHAEASAETLRRRLHASIGQTLRFSRDEVAALADELGRVAAVARGYHMDHVA